MVDRRFSHAGNMIDMRRCTEAKRGTVTVFASSKYKDYLYFKYVRSKSKNIVVVVFTWGAGGGGCLKVLVASSHLPCQSSASGPCW